MSGDGELALRSLRAQALRATGSGADPVGVALSFAFHRADREELRMLLRSRRDQISAAMQDVAARRGHGIAAGYLSPVHAAVMHRGVLRMQADIDWHDEIDKIIAELPDEDA